jgi:hypothetical protein
MQKETTINGLQERQDTPQVLTTSEESLNSMRSSSVSNVNSPDTASMLVSHSGCGYYLRKESRISAHTVFVLGIDGKPLTPTTKAKAKKLLKGKQAKPVWNKFSKFGIQMLVETSKITPKTSLGCDFGTKFEGYSVVVGKENNLAVMWKLPDKKKIVRKLEERKQLRRARRFMNCRRRECRSDNKNKTGFIAPSQSVIVNSRLKCMQEFFRCYPIDAIAIEDVRFNHRDKRWGKNFSTVEVGKQKIYDWCKYRASLQLYDGRETKELREQYGYKKSSSKSAEVYNAHCSDALALAVDVFASQYVEPDNFVVADDTYRCVHRKLHDAQFSIGGVRHKYSTGSFRGIRKGTMCEFGQIVGGTKNNIWYRNFTPKPQNGKSLKKLSWLSHHFKSRMVGI